MSWSFLGFGLILSTSPIHYVKLVNNAAITVGPIILQYPFYAGIMGIMADTGLINILADKISEISSAETLGFYSFISGGLVNMFIPSGGGQWAVQGPVMIEAAENLNVEPYVVVLGVAYGDQWTNMIQPFWTIPLLAIAGLHAADNGVYICYFYSNRIPIWWSFVILRFWLIKTRQKNFSFHFFIRSICDPSTKYFGTFFFVFIQSLRILPDIGLVFLFEIRNFSF